VSNIRQKTKRGEIQEYTKTGSGTEVHCQEEIIGSDVDLCTALAAMVRQHTGTRVPGSCSAHPVESNFCKPMSSAIAFTHPQRAGSVKKLERLEIA
jgi:hypothetical protein